MREIKFRAWSKRDNKMDFDIGLGDEFGTLAGAIMKACNVYDVMQFTGLKDKNGKDLYEGDIVHKYNEVNPEFGFETYKIEWSDSRACFHLQVTDELGVKDWGGYLLYKTSEKLEIIGNIYEDQGR